MRTIPVGNMFAFVDDEDFDFLNRFVWYINRSDEKIYANTMLLINGKQAKISMHRLLVAKQSTSPVDHRDHNTLNNQKENLRVCSLAGNSQNQLKTKRKTSSIYKGVHRGKHNWVAQINSMTIKGNHAYLGSFKSEVDAAKAYDKAAIERFGEYANLNFK